jgi:hypothetical protein
VFEPAHFVMEAGMMMGLKQQAEAAPEGVSISSEVNNVWLKTKEVR